jgi:hypothetical protein
MSNRFKRAAEQKKVAPGGSTEKEVRSSEKSDSLVDGFPKKEIRKVYSFSLSDEAFAKLDKLAKEIGRSRSEAMDLLIKKFL